MWKTAIVTVVGAVISPVDRRAVIVWIVQWIKNVFPTAVRAAGVVSTALWIADHSETTAVAHVFHSFYA